MDSKHALILYASAGHGHFKAAQAIEKLIQRGSVPASVEVLDTLDWTSPSFKRSYAGGYIHLIEKWPAVWGVLYRLTHLWASMRWTRPLRTFYNRFMTPKLIKKILTENPACVLSTHFMGADIAASLKKNGYTGKVITVITDFLVHAFWVAPADEYWVACEETRKALNRFGVADSRIFVTGIPVEPKFYETLSIEGIRSKLGLDVKRPTVLLTSGGSGSGLSRELVANLCERLPSAQFLIVCGKNHKLEEDLKTLKQTLPQIHLFGFVNTMDELMSAADLVVGKAGGLTLSEAMAKGRPFVAVKPVPGQEEFNAACLEGQGAGLWVRDLNHLVDKIKPLLESGQLEVMQNNTRRMRPEHGLRIIAARLDAALDSKG